MRTKHGIPQAELDEIVERDKKCVYCKKKMIDPWTPTNRNDSVTIEHLNHKKDWDSVRSYLSEGKPVSSIVAICCGACNTNRRAKSLREWFDKSDYCISGGINYDSVSHVVRNYIDKYES